ncbi:MAG: hypothetical protein SynsKO_24560 [Synoicihabitans sp.]
MRRLSPLIAFAFVLSVVTLPLWAADGSAASGGRDRSPAAPVVSAVAGITGIAISPLLGTGVYGAYQYFKTPAEERHTLPWFAQVSFWLPALALVGAAAAKDAAGAALPPGWKKPLDVLDTLENKVTGLVAAGAVVPFSMSILSKVILGSGDGMALAPEVISTGSLATMHMAAIDWSWLLNILTVPFGVAIYVVVWMASHAINGLILLSPWGAIDASLKAAKTAMFGLVTLSATIDPVFGAILSGVVIVIAWLIAGWSFRLTVFSWIFCWDFFTRRSGRFSVGMHRTSAFAGVGLKGVPQRTYGKLARDDAGNNTFVYKPWMVMKERSVPFPDGANLAAGRGAFFSNVTDGESEILVLPPRYRTHESEFASMYGLQGGVAPIGLNKAWSWLRSALGFGRSSAISAA